MEMVSLDEILTVKRIFWPSLELYKQQIEIIDSAITNDETYVVGNNKSGKGMASAVLAVSSFQVCQSLGLTCRIMTTSTSADHLDVMWGEIGRLLTTASQPMLYNPALPLQKQLLILNAKEVRRASEMEAKIPYNFLKGMVYSDPQKMAGHHADWTLGICDEASSAEDELLKRWQGWCRHKLFIGNAENCNNFYRDAIMGGDIPASNGRFHRKIIRITADDSPNVLFGLSQKAYGKEPSGELVTAGVLSWDEYALLRKTLPPERQCVVLDAQFYEGKEVKLYAPFLRQAIDAAADLRGKSRTGKALGIDTAEGGDDTSMCVGDEFGFLEMRSRKTPNTDQICGEVIAFANEWKVPPEKWYFDRGGGGRQHADRLRGLGFPVKTIGFGERPSLEIKHGKQLIASRKEMKEDQYAYVYIRDEMYHQLALAIEGIVYKDDKGVVSRTVEQPYGIPCDSPGFIELHRQMALIPRVTDTWSMYDSNGRIRMLQKNSKPGNDEPCMSKIIGCSPDELDAAVLCYHGVFAKDLRATARVG